MSDPISFLSGFASLVESLVHRPDDVEAQKTALKSLTLTGRARAHRITVGDVNARMSELTQSDPGSSELETCTTLSQRMAGHSVSSFHFLAEVRPADLLGVARAVALEPARGDDGAAFDAAMLALVPTTISVSLGPTGFVRQATPPMGMKPISAPPARTPSRGVGAIDERKPSPLNVRELNLFAAGPEKRGDDSKKMIESALMRHPHSRSLDDLLIRVRGPLTPENASPLIEELCRAAEDYASEGIWIGVLDVIEQLMARESTITEDAALKRAFGIQYRRLSKTGILRGVAQLLPHRKEARDVVHTFLQRMGEPAADVLIDLLVTADKAGDRRAYREAILDCPDAATPLIHLLGDPRWFVVRNAAELLGDMRIEAAEERLVDVLAHIDSRCRRSATHALGRIASKRALHAIAQRMTDPDPAVRLQAALGVGAARNPRAVPLLIDALKRETEPEVQSALLSALGKAPTPEAVERLAEEAKPGPLLSRRSQAHRLAAIQALGDGGTHEARLVLRRFLSDKDKEVRALADRLLRESSQGVAATA
jgi:HEAT repeat protein